jgi:hypothetical protein
LLWQQKLTSIRNLGFTINCHLRMRARCRTVVSFVHHQEFGFLSSCRCCNLYTDWVVGVANLFTNLLRHGRVRRRVLGGSGS